MTNPPPCNLPHQPLIAQSAIESHGFNLEYHRQPAWELPEKTILRDKIIIHLSSGFMEQKLNGKLQSTNIQPGYVSILPADNLHTSKWNETMEFILISLDSSLIKRLANTMNYAQQIIIQPRFAAPEFLIQQIGLSLLSELKSPDNLDYFYTESLINMLIVQLLRHYSIQQPKTLDFTSGLANSKLKQIFNYINDNLAQELKLVDLAQQLNLSSYHFARLFKQSTGIPPYQYLTQIRLDRAKTLLLNSQLSILEIAHSVGFKNHSHFTRVFRQHLGITPKQYRQNF